MKINEEIRRLVLERTAEGAREAALLWIVFSALDALITGRLTAMWLTANTTGALGIWVFAIYIEIRAKEHA